MYADGLLNYLNAKATREQSRNYTGFSVLKAFVDHIESGKEGLLQCGACNGYFTSAASLKAHRSGGCSNHHDPKEWPRMNGQPVCLLCMTTFPQTLLIKTHIRQEHNEEQRKAVGYSNEVGLHIVGNEVVASRSFKGYLATDDYSVSALSQDRGRYLRQEIKLHSILKAEHKGLQTLKQISTAANGKHFPPIGLSYGACVENEHLTITCSRKNVVRNYKNQLGILESLTELNEISLSANHALKNYTVSRIVWGHEHIGFVMHSNIPMSLRRLPVPYFWEMFRDYASRFDLLFSMLSLARSAAERGVYVPDITQVDLWRWLDQGSGAFPVFVGAIGCSKIGGEYTAEDFEHPFLVLTDSQKRFPHPSSNCYKHIVAFACLVKHPKYYRHGFPNDEWTYNPRALTMIEITKELLIEYVSRWN